MSQGLGKTQRAVLEAIPRDEWVWRGHIVWKVVGRHAPRSQRESVYRAIRLLVARGNLVTRNSAPWVVATPSDNPTRQGEDHCAAIEQSVLSVGECHQRFSNDNTYWWDQ